MHLQMAKMDGFNTMDVTDKIKIVRKSWAILNDK